MEIRFLGGRGTSSTGQLDSRSQIATTFFSSHWLGPWVRFITSTAKFETGPPWALLEMHCREKMSQFGGSWSLFYHVHRSSFPIRECLDSRRQRPPPPHALLWSGGSRLRAAGDRYTATQLKSCDLLQKLACQCQQQIILFHWVMVKRSMKIGYLLWPREMISRNCLQTSLLSADCLVAADIYCSVDTYGMILVKYSNFLSCSTTSDAILTDFGLRLCKTSTWQNKIWHIQCRAKERELS